ncbi:MAG: TlpA family protein disulfide reductase [Nitrosomonadales bacterium]|jgi:thiol-disulfide isomerase/thioredoxin|nr:MAG: TlpA family protein disulfide reductase [Nitrosomonadales bacterium]
MTTLGKTLLYIGVAALAVTAGFFLQGTQTSSNPEPRAIVPTTNNGANAILSSALPDLQGKRQSISQWRGKVLVVNFWATWCEPCRREMPEFIELQDELRDQGLLFIGIALDHKSKVIQFSKEIGVNYPILLGGIEAMALAEAAGNRHAVLPFTVIFDRNGEIISTHIGRIARDKLEPILKPLL